MYRIINDHQIFRTETGAIIPVCADNSDYKKYLKWLEDGNTPIAIKPSNYHVLDDSNNWIIDESKRAELIQIIGEKIDTKTEHDIIYTFVFNNVEIRLNRDDQFNFSQDVLIKDTHDYPHTIKALNGFYELQNADEYQNMYNAGLQHKNALLRSGWTAKAELATLTTTQLIEKLT